MREQIVVRAALGAVASLERADAEALATNPGPAPRPGRSWRGGRLALPGGRQHRRNRAGSA
jgi:hypothetical protein